MEEIKYPKQFINYRPIGRRSGRPITETAGWIKLWDRNRSFIDLTSCPDDKEEDVDEEEYGK
jgi:hypothetical protein